MLYELFFVSVLNVKMVHIEIETKPSMPSMLISSFSLIFSINLGFVTSTFVNLKELVVLMDQILKLS